MGCLLDSCKPVLYQVDCVQCSRTKQSRIRISLLSLILYIVENKGAAPRTRLWERAQHRIENPLGDGEAIHSQILDQYCILEKVSMLTVLEGG